ncbi:MAG TPA: hypothetical protein VGF60_05015 [Xanthobacteraceae bacterium]
MGGARVGRLIGIAGIAFALAGAGSTRAKADVIDGDWCNAEGKQMSIRGPEIVTPGGKQTRGDYTRHSFSYVVPAGEPGAGEIVSIILLNELLAHARQGSADGPWQEWRRCTAKVS